MGRRLLIVDDHAGFRAAARALAERAGFDVVGEAHDAASADAARVLLAPDAVLLDVMLPGTDGIELAAAWAAGPAAPAVLLTSTRTAATYGDRVEGAAAVGFVEKHRLTPALLADLLG